MAITRGPNSITDGLTVCLDAKDPNSYSGTGTTWTDVSSTGFNGTISSAVYNSSGYFSCNGTNQYMSVNTDVNNNSTLNNCKTWEIWINPDTIPASGTFSNIFQKSPNWNAGDTIGMQFIYGNLRFSYGTNWGGLIITSNSNLSTGNWYQIVGIASTSSTLITQKGYLNGVFKNSQNYTIDNTNILLPTNSQNLKLSTGSGAYFHGKTAILRIYNRVLSDDEILQNYNSTKSRFGL